MSNVPSITLWQQLAEPRGKVRRELGCPGSPPAFAGGPGTSSSHPCPCPLWLCQGEDEEEVALQSKTTPAWGQILAQLQEL